MKSSDEIKKGLEVCNIWMVNEPNHCSECPYFCTKDCADTLMKDALALIQQLQKDKDDLLEERELNDFLRDKVKQLEAERDAAVADLAHVKDCDTCKYDNACLTGEKDCFCCHEKSCPCLTCQYEWRGVQKED